MSKFFVQGSFERDDVIRIDGADGHHIRNVLRMKPNQTLILCDGQGTDYECVIERFDGDSVYVSAREKTRASTEPSVLISLFVAMPKAEKLETVVQKAVELGVYEIIPFFSERCVSRPDARSIEKKTERCRKISEEAAKQCNRGIIPQIYTAVDFSGMLQRAASSELPIMAYEGERETSLKSVLLKKRNLFKASVVIGSEGGFTPEEVDLARLAGLYTVSLGPRILRCETAPIAMLSAIMYHTGNI